MTIHSKGSSPTWYRLWEYGIILSSNPHVRFVAHGQLFHLGFASTQRYAPRARPPPGMGDGDFLSFRLRASWRTDNLVPLGYFVRCLKASVEMVTPRMIHESAYASIALIAFMAWRRCGIVEHLAAWTGYTVV
jgi:hypothetical protein